MSFVIRSFWTTKGIGSCGNPHGTNFVRFSPSFGLEQTSTFTMKSIAMTQLHHSTDTEVTLCVSCAYCSTAFMNVHLSKWPHCRWELNGSVTDLYACLPVRLVILLHGNAWSKAKDVRVERHLAVRSLQDELWIRLNEGESYWKS